MSASKQDPNASNWQTLFAKYSNNQPAVPIRLFLEIAATCGLILIMGIPRLPGLNSFVTTDETLWLVRSGNFYYALTHHDFAATFQKSHPGVTVMWAGLTGYMRVYPSYQEEYAGQNRPIGLGVLSKRDPTLPLQILSAGRQMMVLFHILTLGLGFLFALRLFGMKPALIGFLLIAFDPFHIALSRVLHLDGLLADLMLLSLLAFLVYLNDHKVITLIVSASAGGLAWLTKSPSLFLIPLIMLLTLFDQLRSKSDWSRSELWKSILQTVKVVAIWGMIGAAVFYLLWPAMWVDPVNSVARILKDAIGYAEAGHDSPVFFNGQIYPNGEIPGISFYPINFLWRTTSVTLLGLIAVLVLFIQRWRFSRSDARSQVSNERDTLQVTDCQIWAVAALLFFALGFTALMTLGLKKFDRYIMPSILPLDLVAGVSLVWLTEWAEQLLPKKWKATLTGVILLSLIAVQAALAGSAFPYYFNYYNPLLGGGQRAAQVMQIGWGEGLDQAARYINSKPNSDKLRVMAWYANGPFSYFSKSRVSALDVDHPWSTDDWNQFNKSDYVVVYIHEWQRNLPAEVLDHLKSLKPEYSIWSNGLEYVRIYKIH